ncbi:hypothetical protein FDUTEX481_09665 [Tolypothrix sp. PCC 7601]|nr:hypothetical protein FDUTEX481_09665 [Tolypothrix sp. PCC 7601]
MALLFQFLVFVKGHLVIGNWCLVFGVCYFPSSPSSPSPQSPVPSPQSYGILKFEF